MTNSLSKETSVILTSVTHFSAAHRLTQEHIYVTALSFALLSKKAGACKRGQINSCRDRRPLFCMSHLYSLSTALRQAGVLDFHFQKTNIKCCTLSHKK